MCSFHQQPVRGALTWFWDVGSFGSNWRKGRNFVHGDCLIGVSLFS